MKILIADDDAIVRSVVQRVILAGSHFAIEAENGLQALSLIERADPDLLVTDLRMPLFDGFELIDAVRSSPFHAKLPIVCLSSVNDREEITRLAGFGIEDYLLKPVRQADLSERLRAVIQRTSEWKAERAAAAAPSAGTRSVLVIDPDPAFRAFVGSVLAPDFTVIEAATGADGVSAFSERTPRPSVVLVAEGLHMLSPERVAQLVRKVAGQKPMSMVSVVLVTGEPDVAPETATKFDGVVTRSRVREQFVSATRKWFAAA
jgi:DNA-binding response OmpR family regulator